MTADESRNVFPRLGSFETMTWTDIQQARLGHPVSKDEPDLLKEAPRRLEQIGKGDFDLFSLRITGAGRVWGIKIEHVYYVLWWDAQHRVYPWEPSNT